MTQQQNYSQKKYRITCSLLNSWKRILDCDKEVFENEEKDTMSLEDKIEVERNKRINEFLKTLKKEPIEDNIYMAKGREFENQVCNGEDEEFSPLIKNAAFQVIVHKDEVIRGINIQLYGILDVLKAGYIADIKRVVRYKPRKYKTSTQHPMYLYLVPEAIDFTYLVCDDSGKHHYEVYERQNSENIIKIASNFLSWIETHNLLEIYKEKWIVK